MKKHRYRNLFGTHLPPSAALSNDFLTVALFDECHRSRGVPQEILPGPFCFVTGSVARVTLKK